MTTMPFSGRTFIITGGASGLGEATVRHFASLGANCAILDRDAEKGQALATELGQKVAFFAIDATNEESIKKAIDDTVTRFGSTLAGAVNCAGVGAAALTLDRKGRPHDSKMFDFLMQVNLYGTFHTCKHVATAMQNNAPNSDGQRGVLINVASLAALDGQKGQVAYAASKGAVAAITLPMARDLGQFGIRVVTICPGVFDTPMMARASEAVRNGLETSIVSPKRLGYPSEFAQFCQQVVENKYLNGVTIRLDAGLRMGFAEKARL
eukprot:NODE_3312_length_1000_cov_44.733964_g3046_i0.p1 GENE.NODE_3312_length_1000_cov_44.733964_g3046_i0~~NODE_3312_length_1000_cov_44.733964_g3046_i0.p1  ORF type:complete len:266 (+),score=36.08 NODE_3312_length_1000_cov_44.733964_g3046_i0:89-886(+)